MIETYSHKLLSSVKEYIDYRLLKDLQAFSIKTGTLFRYTDNKFSNKTVYGSSYAQWSYHKEVSGVIVPSGFGSYTRTGDGLHIDFQNGRILFDSGHTNLSITGTWTVPNINTYITTYPTSKLISQENFKVSPDFKNPSTYLPPYSNVLPGLFLRLAETNNEPWAFGGEQMTEYNIAITALVNNSRYLVGLFDIIRDLEERNIPILSTTPKDIYGDLKDSDWNYNNFLTNNNDYALITDSYLKFIEIDNFSERNPDVYMGFGMITIKTNRFPHQEFP